MDQGPGELSRLLSREGDLWLFWSFGPGRSCHLFNTDNRALCFFSGRILQLDLVLIEFVADVVPDDEVRSLDLVLGAAGIFIAGSIKADVKLLGLVLLIGCARRLKILQAGGAFLLSGRSRQGAYENNRQ